MIISRILIDWYLKNKRDLPWRNTSDPYYIWVSEVILQQTRVAQGLSYYERFISAFPDIKSLANEDIKNVLKLWQGLGYYSRARNIHEGAKYVLQNYGGKLPTDYKELLSIRGIGEYTASAIASIAYNKSYPVVDGNVNRVIARIFGISEPVNSREGENKVKNIAAELINKSEPGLHNQAIMEFGALQCIPKNPNCEICPLSKNCIAFKNNLTDQLPVKIKKEKITKRYFYYIIVYTNHTVFLRKREKDDIWKGLYEFPLIETSKKLSFENLLKSKEWAKFFQNKEVSILGDSKKYTHQLTHQTIETEFIKLKIDSEGFSMKGYKSIKMNEFHEYPISRLIERYIEEHGL